MHLLPKESALFGKTGHYKEIGVDPKKIEAVINWSPPTDCREVESFLGFANYHQNHIKEYAKLACPLYELTGPKAPFHWDVPQQEASEALKSALVSAPVLAYPNSTDMFILDTDASDNATGAELLQLQEGEERVISYGSFSLTPTQRNYCTTRKELLTLI